MICNPVQKLWNWCGGASWEVWTFGFLDFWYFLYQATARPPEAPPQFCEPYGKRAEEALRASGMWDKIEPKLVYGENIAHTAQFVQTGNAQVGIIALALAVNSELASKGG